MVETLQKVRSLLQARIDGKAISLAEGGCIRDTVEATALSYLSETGFISGLKEAVAILNEEIQASSIQEENH